MQGVCEKKELKLLIYYITRKHDLEDTLKEISKHGPDYIITEITTPICFYDYNTFNVIKKASPNIKIIIGGIHVTILPEEVLKQCEGSDYIVRQEYFTVPEIIFTENNSANSDNKGNISEIKGIS